MTRAPLAATPAAPAQYRPVDDAAIRALSETGTEIHLVATAESPEEAVALAKRSFGQTVDKQPSEVSMARVTVRNYGVGAEDSPGAEGSKLVIEDRLVWVVIFEDFKNFAFGPAPESGASKAAEFDVTRLAVYVDEATNDFLRAETFEQFGK
ncbi:MAG: hypothetical protein QM633_10335 [Propionicimonas sp.]